MVTVNGIYSFTAKEIAPGEVEEFILELTQPYTIRYFMAPRNGTENLWIDDILIGDRTVFPNNNAVGGMPLEMFYNEGTRLMFDEKVPLGVPIRVKIRNLADKARTLRMSVFGENERHGDA